MKIKMILLCSVIAEFACGTAYAADCHVDRYNFYYGQDTSTHMMVKSGKSCGSTIDPHRSGLTSLVIAQQAQNGAAITPNGLRWEYHTRPGFIGKDGFVVQATGESMDNRGHNFSGNSRINVDVDVVP